MADLRKKRKRRSARSARLIPLLPSMLTTLGLTFGLASIVTSISLRGEFSEQWLFNRFWWAAAFIGMAVLVDMLDGRIARALNSESRFGASYDSLCDLVSFGVAPAVLLYVWGLSDYGKPGLMAMLFYVVCTALRLARFNVQFTTKERRVFTGLPSPMAAGLVFSPILLLSEFQITTIPIMESFYLFCMPIVGLVMVSEVPCRKFPKIERFGPFSTLVAAAIITTALITNPGVVAVSVTYCYFLLELGRCAWNIASKVKSRDNSPEPLAGDES
ncbi:MAG: CDP-diacylglycerol--serine O-phosphatidyltransferase [Candidatus Dadabacteria bacterium]|nr:CDP-diacylglycerol--serine O-phosphatidyltransferase [Candidatus Dadabacteria bacterium]